MVLMIKVHNVLFWHSISTIANMKLKYRIQNDNGTFLNAGTGLDSWFTLGQARKIVGEGQRIVEHDGVNVLWEVL